MYSWPDGELKQTLDLGNTGLIPLEVVIVNRIYSQFFTINMCLWMNKLSWSHLYADKVLA